MAGVVRRRCTRNAVQGKVFLPVKRRTAQTRPVNSDHAGDAELEATCSKSFSSRRCWPWRSFSSGFCRSSARHQQIEVPSAVTEVGRRRRRWHGHRHHRRGWHRHSGLTFLSWSSTLLWQRVWVAKAPRGCHRQFVLVAALPPLPGLGVRHSKYTRKSILAADYASGILLRHACVAAGMTSSNREMRIVKALLVLIFFLLPTLAATQPTSGWPVRIERDENREPVALQTVIHRCRRSTARREIEDGSSPSSTSASKRTIVGVGSGATIRSRWTAVTVILKVLRGTHAEDARGC